MKARYTWMTAASSTSTKMEKSLFLTTMLATLEASTANNVHANDFFLSIAVLDLRDLFWLIGGDKPSRGTKLSGSNEDRETYIFSCSADHEQNWQSYPVDPYSAESADNT